MATPSFDSVDDVLGGRRVLADVTELVIANPAYASSKTTAQNVILATSAGSISGESTDTLLTTSCGPTSKAPFPQQTRAPRLFDLVNDVLVTLTVSSSATGTNCSGTDNMQFKVEDKLNSAHNSTKTLTLSANLIQMAEGDFDFDGYDDLFVLNDTEAFIASASDVETPSSGLTFGTSTATGSSRSPLNEPAVGDFNDDGILDVAWVGADWTGGGSIAQSVYFASVCPKAVSGTVCASASKFDVILNPLSSTAISLDTYNSGCSSVVRTSAVTAGKYSGNGIDQLVIAYVNSSCNEVHALWYEFDGSMVATQLQDSTLVADGSYFPTAVYATTSYLNWFSSSPQAIVAFAGSKFVSENLVQQTGVSLLSFASGSASSQTALRSASALPTLAGLAVGVLGTPSSGFTTTASFVPSITLLLAGAENYLDIYSVNTATYTPSYASTYTLSNYTETSNQQSSVPNAAGSLLRAGDLLGESIRVGSPEIVRVSDTSGANGQPQLVLSLPPQHVDYILGNGSSAAAVVNFSAVDTYSAQYSTAVTSSSQSSSSSTTSYTHSVKTTTSESGKVAFVPAFGVSATFSQVSEQTYSNSIDTTYNTYSSEEFDASTATTSSDVLWVTFQDYNIYNYPVIGETACSVDTTTCTSDSQLYMTISGPDDVFTAAVAADTVEWYQPYHEPLQIFSYPWDETELLARLTSPTLLTSASPTGFYTDNTVQKQSVSWTSGNGSNVTTGSTSTASFDTDSSITLGTPSLDDADSGVSLSSSLDYASSTALTTLYTSITQVGASSGFEVAKPGSFASPDEYQYLVQPFIVGRTNDSGVVQTISLDTDVQTTGAVKSMFVADPTANGAGAWWASASNYSNFIDVALNHPARWSPSIYSEYSDPIPAPCLSRGDAGDTWCAVFNYYDATDDLWTNEFYWMRGLLVTVDGLAGPQRTNATAGDTVYLQARVYNYSLQDMASGDSVHVRFYRQEIDEKYNTIGDSVLINSSDIILDPLPAFSSTTSSDSNWSTATTTLNTTDLGDTYQLFWVVVWAQDSSGNLISELPGHGLASLPETLTAIGDVALETVTFNDVLASIVDRSKTTTFSNNVGYLHQSFYVAASTTTATALASRGVANPTTATSSSLTLDDTGPSERPVQQHDTTTLHGSLTSPVERSGVVVLFYEDDSKTAFEMEVLPHLRAGSAHEVRVPYHAKSCGAHDILMIAAPGKKDETRRHIAVDVDCSTPTPTPTATVPPTATPAVRGSDNDDGCTMQTTARPNNSIWLLLGGAVLILRRYRVQEKNKATRHMPRFGSIGAP